MKSLVKVLFAAMFCLFFCQSNVEAQGLKNALNKVKGAINEAATSVTSGSKDEPTSEGPAKPIAPEVKNSVSQLRGYLGLTKTEFSAKMKALGFAEGEDDMGYGGVVYKSKKASYVFAVNYGMRDGKELVNDISKATVSKKPVIATLKTEFLSYSKQCADVKAELKEAILKPVDRKSPKATAKNAENRTAKFLPALDVFAKANEDGSVMESYSERDYDYSVTLMYSKVTSFSMLTIRIIDKTIESMMG